MTNNEDINVNLVIEQSNNEPKDNEPKATTREIIIVAFIVGAISNILLGIISGIVGWFREKPVETIKTDTIIVERWDTITIEKPTEIIRYVMRHDTIRDSTITIIMDGDSAAPTAIIPIERIIYQDSTENAKYKAFLSGYRAALDSITIECLNKETTITITEREKASRWGVGIQAGVGISPKGIAAPYVGIGIQYRLLGK